MLKVEITSRPVLDALQQLISRIQTPDRALMEIGEDLADSTMERFRDGKGPGGKEWGSKEDSTLDRYNRMFGRSFPEPLIGPSSRLALDISWQLVGDKAVEIGSPTPYANMQQFGGTKAQWPHLWGDIPARPFLGISDADEENILAIIGGYLLPD